MKSIPLRPSGIWLVCIAACCIFLSCARPVATATEINLIPTPEKLEIKPGFFHTNKHTVILLPDTQAEYTLLAQILNANMFPHLQKEMQIATSSTSKNAIRFVRCDDPEVAMPETYRLEVDQNGVSIRAGSNAGLFYGLQSLLQLISPEGIPYVSLLDRPRFAYRGLHLDVSRNFFSKEFVMKTIDLMAFYKLNRFHWHLTDGTGWRIQIDQYPLLTQKASFRDKSNWKAWWDGDRRFVTEGTDSAYGGYYTKADIREVVAYARSKYITIIPEIEMPGHSEEVFVAYPELSCSGQPYQNSDFCIGNEETFAFLENVLTEVIDLFPSEYIHIGGDEAAKTAWQTCPKCRKRMRNEGLQNTDELQSYLVRRIEKFLVSNGRKLIGWDEIIDGGLAPEATVMSWRNDQRAVQAVREGHDVIMTPGSYLYFDFYQANPQTQPEAIGGYTPVKRVYHYEPVPAGFIPEESNHILGVQANVWTEYIPDEQHAEYMIYPRLLALSEIAWSAKDKRNWQAFKPRLNKHVSWLHAMGINAFPLSYEIETTLRVDTVRKQIEVWLDAEKYPSQIRFTTDGTMPTQTSALYDSLIVVKDSAIIKAALFENGKRMGDATEKKVDYHRGIGKKIVYHSALYEGYMAGGTHALLDGYRGGFTYLDGRWQGYTNSLDATIDMGEMTVIRKVSARFMQLTGPGVYQPGEVQLWISENGSDFTLCQTIPTQIPAENSELAFQEYTFLGNWQTRYLRIKAKEVHHHQFIFTDEIVVW